MNLEKAAVVDHIRSSARSYDWLGLFDDLRIPDSLERIVHCPDGSCTLPLWKDRTACAFSSVPRMDSAGLGSVLGLFVQLSFAVVGASSEKAAHHSEIV